jgi:hypothetical protein
LSATTIPIGREYRLRQEQEHAQAKPNGAAQPPQFIRADQVEPKAVDWTWYPYVPGGMITLIGGKGGNGKGLVCIDLAACTTKGTLWPDRTEKATAGHVIWGETEDPINEVLVPRLIAAGADRSRVDICDAKNFALANLRDVIKREGTRLVVLSPFMSFLQGLVEANSDLSVRKILEELQAGITDTGCAIVGITHLNKKPGLDALERVLGSVAFVNFARSVLLVAPDREQEGFIRFVHAKHNLSAKGPDLLYQPVQTSQDPRGQYLKLEWTAAESNVDQDQLFERKTGQDERSLSAREWIINYLEEYGDTPGELVIDAGRKAGFSEDALAKARGREKRIQSRKGGWGQGWLWCLTRAPKKDKVRECPSS